MSILNSKPILISTAIFGLLAGFAYVSLEPSSSAPSSEIQELAHKSDSKHPQMAGPSQPQSTQDLSSLNKLVQNAAEKLQADSAHEAPIPSAKELELLKEKIQDIDLEIQRDDLVARANRGELSPSEQTRFGAMLKQRAQLSSTRLKGLLAQMEREDSQNQEAYAQR